MTHYRLRLLIALLVLSLASGCAAYRTSSSIDAEPDPAAQSITEVLISEGNLSNRRYRVLGPIDVSIKKLTVFHKDPTKQMANEALTAKARAMGADAIINVTYTSGVGLSTWGYIDAYGTGVKLLDQR